MAARRLAYWPSLVIIVLATVAKPALFALSAHFAYLLTSELDVTVARQRWRHSDNILVSNKKKNRDGILTAANISLDRITCLIS